MSTDLSPSRADLSNWRTAPFSRWAFHNIRSILPVAEIESAPGSAWSLPARPVAFDDFISDSGQCSFHCYCIYYFFGWHFVPS